MKHLFLLLLLLPITIAGHKTLIEPTQYTASSEATSSSSHDARPSPLFQAIISLMELLMQQHAESSEPLDPELQSMYDEFAALSAEEQHRLISVVAFCLHTLGSK